jgi:hypothetical protein
MRGRAAFDRSPKILLSRAGDHRTSARGRAPSDRFEIGFDAKSMNPRFNTHRAQEFHCSGNLHALERAKGFASC